MRTRIIAPLTVVVALLAAALVGSAAAQEVVAPEWPGETRHEKYVLVAGNDVDLQTAIAVVHPLSELYHGQTLLFREGSEHPSVYAEAGYQFGCLVVVGGRDSQRLLEEWTTYFPAVPTTVVAGKDRWDTANLVGPAFLRTCTYDPDAVHPWPADG